ncbi:hypothetical protein HZ326_11268 [Fusarium oxysporum f. sp. albedinis]|nr:hypothetical protein HZ326_11268 [Fusarium oxysporum f. sp. albedinis]
MLFCFTEHISVVSVPNASALVAFSEPKIVLSLRTQLMSYSHCSSSPTRSYQTVHRYFNRCSICFCFPHLWFHMI